MQHPSQILQGFRDRTKWPVMNQILKKAGLHPSRGWENSIERFQDWEESSPEIAADASEKLINYFRDYIRFGQKSVRLYKVDPNIVLELKTALDSLDISESIFSSCYPLPLAENELEQCSEVPVYVDKVDAEKGTDYIFSSCRRFQERRVFDQDILNDQAMLGLGEVGDVVVFHTRKTQLYDVVCLRPDEGIIELRVDIALGMSVQDRGPAFRLLLRHLVTMTGECVDSQTISSRAVNFYPLLSQLYDEDGGTICSIGFATGSSYKHYESGRQGNRDVRADIFHSTGAAVDTVNPFALSKNWSRNHSTYVTHPEITLPGNSRIADSSNPVLSEVIITNVFDESDYRFLTEKIEQLIENLSFL